MANSILIIGASGSGKSHSIQYLDEKSTFICNVASKALPFKGWKTKYSIFNKSNLDGNIAKTATAGGLLNTLKYIDKNRPDIKIVVVDDWQYVSSFEFFDRADEDGWQKFTDIGKWIKILATLPSRLRDDLTIIFLTHVEEVVDYRGKKVLKAKTIGKMVDEKLTLEGLFPIVLYSSIRRLEDGNLEYGFETKNAGNNTCKTPLGMFEEEFIPNNLKLIIDSVNKYEN